MSDSSPQLDSADAVIALMRNAALAHVASPVQHGFLVELPSAGEVMVTGDLHGNMNNLRQIIKVADLKANPQRHLVLQELVHELSTFDEACRSHRLVELAAKLKVIYPRRVHLLLGNHEFAEILEMDIGKNGRELNAAFQEGLLQAYGDRWHDVKTAFRGLWQCCPLAIHTANRLFISHSTPSLMNMNGMSLDYIRRAAPADIFRRGSPVFSLLWDRDYQHETAEIIASRMEADLLLVGHTACQDGWRAPNERHIILDSKDFDARYVILPLERPVTQDEAISRIARLYPEE